MGRDSAGSSSVVFNNAVVCVCDLCHCSVVRSDQSRNWLWFDPQRDLDQHYCRLIVNYAMIMYFCFLTRSLKDDSNMDHSLPVVSNIHRKVCGRKV